MTGPVQLSKATFTGGCFWDLEAAFRNVEGVAGTVAGYTGGTEPDPDYEQVSTGSTGHVEALGIVFDPAVVSYDQLLGIFWAMHDPTRPDGRGDYTGPQYRSTIFYHDEKQEEAALASRDRLAASKQYGDRPIVTELLPASTFWPAEACHQQFYEKCGRGYTTSRQIYE
ncbi:MAG: peptide-methionine (S)-S-oxide reductase MsrA [Methanoregula sp.]|jgi:methionine-S-sulfoxide reductase|uniref:peptide-methionine (S)-S-oxide reductase MsrA n=1 Tax=Methanoregula sp. TaxID=2052170 RepID=UPI0025D0CFC4|nr:peptide-methionine (S)-S-oxide reductase MsrA [Methanoregula sp.]MCK9630229.1 peptide-methionine (S)-S-oxide reductase MsrA [Methanoregula sp.]